MNYIKNKIVYFCMEHNNCICSDSDYCITSFDEFVKCKNYNSFQRLYPMIKLINNQDCDHSGIKLNFQGNRLNLQGDRLNLQGDRLNLQGDRLNLQGDRLNLQGDRLNLQGDRLDLQGDRLDLQGDRLDLQGDITNLDHYNNNIKLIKLLLDTCTKIETEKKKIMSMIIFEIILNNLQLVKKNKKFENTVRSKIHTFIKESFNEFEELSKYNNNVNPILTIKRLFDLYFP